MRRGRMGYPPRGFPRGGMFGRPPNQGFNSRRPMGFGSNRGIGCLLPIILLIILAVILFH